MSARSEESAVERLRKQAERAIAEAHGRRTVEPLLERIVSLAADGSEASVFAHRHLAEYRLEDHPWRALLHLRKVVGVHPEDDVVHALMGLSHALLANFRSAVSAYRRAIALSQKNPWYHHNLGHLLDVALDQPALAVRHLEFAHRAAQPVEHEITASLAHCLARLGRIEDARKLAQAACDAAPRNREHKQLLAWIECGAPRDGGDPRRKGVDGRARPLPSTEQPTSPAGEEANEKHEAPRAAKRTKRTERESSRDDAREPVLELLERVMREGGFTSEHLARARRLWLDYRTTRDRERAFRAPKPDVCAAAIEYAIARLHGLDGVTRASVARRYGVSARSVSERFDDIQVVLALKPDDPRYALY
jgi:tetratricopeptide (TPR) repeat protein